MYGLGLRSQDSGFKVNLAHPRQRACLMQSCQKRSCSRLRNAGHALNKLGWALVWVTK